jgi:hypothetical protein
MGQLQIQAVYLSFATRAFKMDVASNIEQIIQEAQTHNSQNDITGQLIYHGGVFIQLLEGEKGKVQRLLGAIACDRSRHENLTVLFHQPMQERVFSDWSMAYQELDNHSLDIVNSIVPWQEIIRASDEGETVTPNKIFMVFKGLRERL